MGLRIAIFGQAAFGREVSERLDSIGHRIVGVWAPPEGRRPDALAALAEERGWPLFRHRRLRRKGIAIPEAVAEHRALRPQLNVLPFTTTILPLEIAHHPPHGSICFHPSLLPAFRGGAALSWQIIMGAQQTGVSVFKISEHVDSGPLVVQRGGVEIAAGDTMASLYFDKLYSMGVQAMVDAVQSIADGSARFTLQGEEGASSQRLIDEEVARIDWSRPAIEIDRLIRGCDPVPGAVTRLEGRDLRLFGCALGDEDCSAPPGTLLAIRDGSLEIATSAGVVRVKRVQVGGGGRVEAHGAGLVPGLRFR